MEFVCDLTWFWVAAMICDGETVSPRALTELYMFYDQGVMKYEKIQFLKGYRRFPQFRPIHLIQSIASRLIISSFSEYAPFGKIYNLFALLASSDMLSRNGMFAPQTSPSCSPGCVQTSPQSS